VCVMYCLQKQYLLPISKLIQIAIQPGEVLQVPVQRGPYSLQISEVCCKCDD
jgi:hypothetical protein